MPDNKGSLATSSWSNTEYLTEQMRKHDYKISSNEWDVYEEKNNEIANVVLATTLRHPVDRWYSLYRFEHLEHRGKIQ